MLDVEGMSEDEYMEKSVVVFALTKEFQTQWESDPFGEPDILDFISRAEEHGTDVKDEVSSLLEAYIVYFAPEPKLSPAQYQTRLERVREYVGFYGPRNADQNDGSNGSNDRSDHRE